MIVTICLVIEDEVVLSRSLDGLEARMTDLTGAWGGMVVVAEAEAS